MFSEVLGSDLRVNKQVSLMPETTRSEIVEKDGMRVGSIWRY